MKKIFLVLLFTKCLTTCAQHQFSVIVEADGTLNGKNLTCHYFDGKNEIFVSDSFINNKLILKGQYYSPYVVLHIEYHDSATTCSGDYFLNNKSAKILINVVNKSEGIFKNIFLKNAIPAFDTAYNPIFRKLSRFRIKEAMEVSDLWTRYGNSILTSDSLRTIHQVAYKRLNDQTLSFIRNHEADYLAFWYFKSQVLEPSLAFFKSDTTYLRSLLVFLTSNFPQRIINSTEGRDVVRKLNVRLLQERIPVVGTKAPLFSISTSKGTKIRLSDFKGKLVLLDFWASWCGPCIRELPFILQLRDKFPDNLLVLIGVNIDRNRSDYNRAIESHQLNWINLFDEGSKITNLFVIEEIPVTILINKDGNIIYDSRNGTDREGLIKLLQENI